MKNYNIAFLTAGIIFLMFSCTFFFVGYHNADLSVNMMLKLAEQGQDYYNAGDEYKIDQIITYPHSYILGMTYMMYSFFGMLMAGLCFGGLINRMDNEK